LFINVSGHGVNHPTEKVTAFHNISTSLVLQVVCVLYKEIFPIPVVPEIPQLMLPDLLLDLCASPPQGIAALMALIDGHHNWKPLVTAVGISR